MVLSTSLQKFHLPNTEAEKSFLKKCKNKPIYWVILTFFQGKYYQEYFVWDDGNGVE